MRKLLFTFLCMSVTMLTAQVNLSDSVSAFFNTNKPASTYEASVNNPLTTGINTSSTCAKYTTGGVKWELLWSDLLGGNIDFSESTIITMKVYTTSAISSSPKVYLKLQQNKGGTTCEVQNVVYDSANNGTWQELSFDLSTAGNFDPNVNYFDKIILLFNASEAVAGNEWYFDDITLPGFTPKSRDLNYYVTDNTNAATSMKVVINGQDVVLNDDGTGTDNTASDNLWSGTAISLPTKNVVNPTLGDHHWTLWVDGEATDVAEDITIEFQNNIDNVARTYGSIPELTSYVDFETLTPSFDKSHPSATYMDNEVNGDKSGINSSNTCGKYITSNETWEVIGTTNLGGTIDFSDIKIFQMKVKSDAPAGTKVFFKVVKEGTDDRLEVQDVTYGGSGDWELLTFNFTVLAPIADNYDKIVLCFDAGTATNGRTWFFDDIQGPPFKSKQGQIEFFITDNNADATSMSIMIDGADEVGLNDAGTGADLTAGDHIWSGISSLYDISNYQNVTQGNHIWQLKADGALVGDVANIDVDSLTETVEDDYTNTVTVIEFKADMEGRPTFFIDDVFLHISNINVGETIKIYDLNGIVRAQLPVNSSTATVDVSNYPKGIYLLNFGGSHNSLKFIKR